MVDERNDVPHDEPQADDTDVSGLEGTVSSFDEARGADPMTDTTEYDTDLDHGTDTAPDASQVPQDPVLTAPEKKEYLSPATKERWAKIKESLTKKRELHNPFAGTGQRLDKIVKGTKANVKLAGAYAAYHLADMKDGYVDSFKKKKSVRVATYVTLGAVALGTVGGIFVGTGYMKRDDRSRPNLMNKTAQTGTQTAGQPKASPLLPPAASIKAAPSVGAPPVVAPPVVTSTAADYAASKKAPLIGFTDAVLGTGAAVTNTTATFQATPKAQTQILGLSPAVTGTADTVQVGASTVAPPSISVVPPAVAIPPASAPVKTPLIGFTDAVFMTELYDGKEHRLNNPAFIIKSAGQERIIEISTRQHGLVRDHSPRYTLENTFDGHKVRIQGVAATPYNGKTSAHEILDISLKDAQSIELSIPADKYGREIGVSLSPTFNSSEVRSLVKGKTLSAENLQGVKQYAKDGKLLLVYDVAARNEKNQIVQSYKAPIIITFDGEATPATTYGTVKQRASTPAKSTTEPAKPAVEVQAVVETSLEQKLDEQTIVYEQPVPQPLPSINVTGTQNIYNGTDAEPSTVMIQSDGQETKVYENGKLVEPNGSASGSIQDYRSNSISNASKTSDGFYNPDVLSDEQIAVADNQNENLPPINEIDDRLVSAHSKVMELEKRMAALEDAGDEHDLKYPKRQQFHNTDYDTRKQELVWLDKQLYAIATDLKNDVEKLNNGFTKECQDAQQRVGQYKDLDRQTTKINDCDNKAMDMIQRSLDAISKGAVFENKLEEFKRLYGQPDFELQVPNLEFEIPAAKNQYNSSTEIELHQ